MQRIRDSFDRQGFMRTLGAVLESVEPGTVTIACRFDQGLTQQRGLFHGGVVATLVDVACGYAALSVMPADREVLTVEFTVHFLKPAKTDRLIAVGGEIRRLGLPALVRAGRRRRRDRRWDCAAPPPVPAGPCRWRAWAAWGPGP